MKDSTALGWRHWVSRPFGRFVVGASLALAFSFLWSIGLLVVTSDCQEHGWRWIRQHMTYGAVHHIFFPAAFGLLLASIRMDVLRSTSKGFWAVLAGLMILCAYATLDDANGGDQAYEAAPVCKWLEVETSVRHERLISQESRADSWYVDQVGEWRKLKADAESLSNGSRVAQTPSPKDLLRDNLADRSLSEANFVGKTAVFLTWLFLSFVAFFAWYTAASSFQPYFNDEARFRLACVLVLLTPWVPARVYANWYQNWWHQGQDINHSTALAAGLLAIVILGYLAAMGLLKQRISRETVAYVAGMIIAATGFLFSGFEEWFEPIEKTVANARLSLVILVVFVCGFFAVSLARHALLGQDHDNG